MAIEITQKPKIKIPPVAAILGSILLVLLIILAAVYLFFEITINKMSKEIQEKDLAAVPLEKDIKEKENELLPIKQKIEEFGKLLLVHKKQTVIFELLEKITLPNVFFSNFNFTPEKRTVTVSGLTDSFVSLEQQILVLKKEPLLEKIELSGISMDKKGGVSFSLLLIFSSQIYK